MTIARVKPGNWSANETLTSAQMNSVDTNVTNAVDKRSGQSDTVQSTLTFNTGTVTLSGTTTISGALSASSVSQLQMSGTNKVTLVSRSITRAQEITALVADNNTNWYMNTTGLPQNAPTGTTPNSFTSSLYLPLHLPNNVTITAVNVYLTGAASHGALPASKPVFGLFKTNVTTASFTQIGSNATDPSGTVGAFEVVHPIPLTSLSEVTAKGTTRYFILLAPETGANSRSGATVAGVTVTYSTTEYDED